MNKNTKRILALSVMFMFVFMFAAPFVFASIFCVEGDEYPMLRDALEKLSLNDASLSYEPEQSGALGHGFRCGFLGLLHLDIVQERLEREYDLDLVVTAPSVSYKAVMKDGGEIAVESPAALPDRAHVEAVKEPWVKVEIQGCKDCSTQMADEGRVLRQCKI